LATDLATAATDIYSRQYPAHVEDLRVQVRQVRHDEYEDRLDHAHLMGEPGDEAGGEAPDYTYDRAADRHYQERS